LYADVTAPEFGALHKSLSDFAQKGERTYRLRYRPGTAQSSEGLSVNGYGVELQLKRTDYIVIDDREGDAKTEKKAATAEVVLDSDEEVADLKPLSTSDLSSLGVKAASYIMQSKTPFQDLVKLTQDFPKYSTSIAAHNASADFVKEHKSNRGQMAVPAGMNVLWMNGVQLIERQIEPYSLVDLLRKERKFIKGVTDLGLTGQQAVSLLGHKAVASSKSDQEESRRFDWRDDVEENKVIIWMNNLEKDSRYYEFPSDLMSVSFPSSLYLSASAIDRVSSSFNGLIRANYQPLRGTCST
jgi:UDP-glucose:glycoprotein glucosyltransferase